MRSREWKWNGCDANRERIQSVVDIRDDGKVFFRLPLAPLLPPKAPQNNANHSVNKSAILFPVTNTWMEGRFANPWLSSSHLLHRATFILFLYRWEKLSSRSFCHIRLKAYLIHKQTLSSHANGRHCHRSQQQHASIYPSIGLNVRKKSLARLFHPDSLSVCRRQQQKKLRMWFWQKHSNILLLFY